MNQVLKHLVTRIRGELREIEKVLNRIDEGWIRAKQTSDDYYLEGSIDLLLWSTRSREDISLREYTGNEIAEFLRADELDQEAKEIAGRFLSRSE